MTTCPSPDIVGAIRPVFHHRLCDNFNDCLGGEDEGSEMVRCELDLDENGCCASIYTNLGNRDISPVPPEACVKNGLFNGKESYLCENGNLLGWSKKDGHGWTY